MQNMPDFGGQALRWLDLFNFAILCKPVGIGSMAAVGCRISAAKRSTKILPPYWEGVICLLVPEAK